MTLRAPPKPPHATANLVGRFVGLIVLLVIFAGVVWVTATNQQVPVVERTNPLVDAPGEHVSVDGAVIHVQTIGQGNDVTLVIHDDNMAGGALVVPLAESLAEGGRRVVVPDLVGFGLSGRPSSPGRIYSSIGQAETLAAYIAQEGLARVQVVGVGWGGTVAADLAVIEPEAIDGLVLVDVPSLSIDASGWKTMEALPFGVGQAVAYNREGGASAAEDIFLETCPGPADCADPTVLAAFRKAVTVPDTAASIRARRASPVASVAADRIDEIEVPVLIVSTSDRDAVAEISSVFEGASVEVTGEGEVAAPILAAG